MINKTNDAYKTIGEVAELLNLKNKKTGRLNTYILRFWEKEFKQLKPYILNNGRRYYDKKAINLLVEIKFLLKDKGMTIKGVKKLLNDKKAVCIDGDGAFLMHLGNLSTISKIKEMSTN